jgi:hypothetical protein
VSGVNCIQPKDREMHGNMCLGVCVCVRACVRACVRVCVCVGEGG